MSGFGFGAGAALAAVVLLLFVVLVVVLAVFQLPYTTGHNPAPHPLWLPCTFPRSPGSPRRFPSSSSRCKWSNYTSEECRFRA